MSSTVPVVIHILDKEYRIACPEEEQEALLASAAYLNRKMKEIRDSGRVVGAERIAVMAALNITHELLQHNARKDDRTQSVTARIRVLQDKLDAALSKGNQMDL
ncbi:MAG: cell division protein ZapA [Gammaproteobacteria bacterium]